MPQNSAKCAEICATKPKATADSLSAAGRLAAPAMAGWLGMTIKRRFRRTGEHAERPSKLYPPVVKQNSRLADYFEGDVELRMMRTGVTFGGRV